MTTTHLQTARAAHDAHNAQAPRREAYQSREEWRTARVAHAQLGAAVLPDLRHAELADLADVIDATVTVEREVFDLPQLPAIMTEPRNWLASGGLSKQGRAALDAVTPAGWVLYLVGGYTVIATPEGEPYTRHERNYYQPSGEGQPYTYNHTTPRTLAELVAADAELVEIERQIKELADRRATLAAVVTL